MSIKDEDSEDLTPDYKQYVKSGSKTPILDSFSRDLTKMAASGELDPVIGRDVEVERISQILSRRKKNNPVIIGEPGIGKTSIVDLLALRIVQRKVSRNLFNKRILSLDIGSVVAGTKYRGQFEERMKGIIDELKKNPDVIVFIDEIHTLVGAGSSSGSLDASNMVKPALSRGEFQCIGATTLSEYRQHIEKDGALERRFQKVIAEAPTEAETLMILKNVKEKYEEHHSVTYTEEAIEQCVKLTGRYITDRNFPDKALDVLDEAGSRSQLKEIKTPEILTNLEKNLDKTIRDKKIAVSNQDYEEASRLRDVEKRVRLTIEIETRSWEEKLKADKKVVSAEKVAEVISMMTGVPLSKLTENENAKLARMSDDLKGKVIGQSEAVDKITKAILRNRIGLKDPNRPIGSFVFSGPTGTGKTFLAKMVAKHVFGDENAMIRVDMSEYMEKFNATKLIGAPPGYVGHEEGGQLTEKVRRKPYCVVLFDEIEKAHPDIFNTLLQILDEGHITDGLGRKINFKNTLIIMTTNTGQKKASEFSRGVGFGSSSDTKISGASKDIVSKEIHKMFSPEFLNRIDEIVEFNKLSKENIMEIVDLEIKSIVPRFKDLGYKITIGKSLREKMGESGYDEKYGARPLRRLIQKWIEDPIAERIVLGEIKENDKIVLSLNPKAKEEEIPVRVKVEKTKEEEDK